jgi:hypothetical protein
MILHSYGNAAYTVQYSYQYTFFHSHLKVLSSEMDQAESRLIR